MGDAGTMSVLAQDTLTGAGVQTVTGAKTFNNQKLLLRNPANTFSLTLTHPAITSNQNYEEQLPVTWIIYKSGSNTKAKEGFSGGVKYTDTDAFVVLQTNVLANIAANSGSRVIILPGLYTVSAQLAPPSGCGIVGEGTTNNSAQIRPTGDFPAIELNTKTFVTLERLFLSHNQSGYTSSLLNLKGGTTASNNFRDLFIYDFEWKSGHAVGLDNTGGSVYRNNFWNCEFYGFASGVHGTLPGSTNFTNQNRFIGCKWTNFKKALSLTGVASSIFDDNSFLGCTLQSYAGTTHGFDYETGFSGHAWYTMHTGTLIHDLPGATTYATINTGTQLYLNGCYPAWKVNGAGATAGKVKTDDFYTVGRGKSTQSGNASTKVFNIAHGLSSTPTSARISAGSSDATGSPVITYDATNIIVTYPAAPPTGTNNLVLNWEANVF